jgi:SAM-dependent methyltransferase
MTVRAKVHADAAFAKYAESGAYHWSEIGPGLISHNAFTAERYRQVIDRAATRAGDRVLDYGCGDGALLGVLHRRLGRQAHHELHGFDPNPLAVRLAGDILKSHGVPATIHGSAESLPSGYFDCVVCTEVIEHATKPGDLLLDVARLLKPGGRLVVTTPIRLTEVPEDPNHVREWFPGEFAQLFDDRTWRVIAHDQVVPAAAAEVYFWRPIIFARVPVFRLLCNLLSIGAGVNAMSWLRMRPRLFMMQIVIAEKAAR